jgi:mycofactocin biosynthetic radical S-adenosylmethionine protein MftC
MLADVARDGLSAPVNLTWEVTLRCNLNCRHCLSNGGQALRRELSTAECLSVLDELASLKVFQINIGGGEPFLRQDMFAILKYAEGLGIVSCISTNGTLIDAETCQRLTEMEGLYLQVSLDGVDEDTNDRIRGSGSYKKARRAIEELARHGMPFSINTVLTRLSFPQIDSLKAMAHEVGANLRVSRFRPSGRGQKCREELAPTMQQLESFAEWLQRDSQVLTGDSFFSLTSEKRRRMGMDMCGAAKMTCCLSPDGSVYPCAFLQEKDFLAGNIRETSLEELWHHSRVFQSLRMLEVRSCEACFRFDSCRGGCPAVAYYHLGDPSLPDPECLVACVSNRS